MMANEALEIVNRLLEPKRLNYIQEIIFLQSWSGKIYREIALESGYDLDYIKEVGSQLWSSLSEAVGERVTKKNVKLLLTNVVTGNRSKASFLDSSASNSIEFPGSSVPVSSHLYIERPPVEERAYAEVIKPGSLIRIKAPKQMGKTSLLHRILFRAQLMGLHTVMLNLQQADNSTFVSLNRLLRWFCLNISRQLSLEPKLDEYWDEEIGSKVSCSIYFQDYLLKHLDAPVVLAIDETQRIFEYSDLAQDFLPLLRTWHEEAAEMEVWQKLRLVVVHSTESYIPLNISQSPFNVGLPIQLPEFNQAQVLELAKRHWTDATAISPEELEQLMTLVGGHPYLLRLALYQLQQGEVSLPQLLQEAPTQAGIYGDHLRRHWRILQRHPELWTAFRQVVTTAGSTQLEAVTAYRLESMGLIKLRGNLVTPTCELYRLYFSSQFLAEETLNEAIDTVYTDRMEQLEQTNRELRVMVNLDGLTLLASRRYFTDYLNSYWQHLGPDTPPLSLILVDIDFFKGYNDTYGHQAGDVCLQQVATAIRQVVKRPADLVARYGGEEFAVVLPMTSANSAIQIAEKIRAHVKTLAIATVGADVPSASNILTVSLGVSSLIPNAFNSPAMLIAAADQALYQSKLEGRDRATFRPCIGGS